MLEKKGWIIKKQCLDALSSLLGCSGPQRLGRLLALAGADLDARAAVGIAPWRWAPTTLGQSRPRPCSRLRRLPQRRHAGRSPSKRNSPSRPGAAERSRALPRHALRARRLHEAGAKQTAKGRWVSGSLAQQASIRARNALAPAGWPALAQAGPSRLGIVDNLGQD